MGGYRNFYYFQVHSRVDDGNEDDKIITRYFRSGHEVATFIGCCRPTVFKMIRDPDHSIYSKQYVVEKCNPPIPMYEKVKVENTLIS